VLLIDQLRLHEAVRQYRQGIGPRREYAINTTSENELGDLTKILENYVAEPTELLDVTRWASGS
jgi:hypothetical protein